MVRTRAQIGPLIGRERDVAFVRSALSRPDVRFFTLIGPGGVGKTRLALELTADLASQYDDGAHIVYLTKLTDPELGLRAIANTLDLRGTGSSPLSGRLHARLTSAKMLLTLDNLEQVAAVTSELERLLHSCPGVKILATSRTPLRVTDEQILPMRPLQIPNLQQLSTLDELRQNEAVKLLVQRARDFDPSFMVTQTNARNIATICAQLQGLPLAIQIAASWLRALSPAALRRRLATSLPVLTQEDPGLRHPLSLCDTLSWLEDLLSPSLRAIFHRLSVFADGFDAAAAEVVCGGPSGGGTLTAKVPEGVGELLDHGLLCREIVAGEPRFTMPETIREYALERLEACGEAEAIRRRHAAYFLALAEDAAPALFGSTQEALLARLESEHQNLRAALKWTLAHDPDMSIRLAAALWRFWFMRGHIEEGGRWLDRVIATNAGETTVARVRSLNGLGVLISSGGDLERARELQDVSLALAREIDDSWGVAAALGDLAIIEFLQTGNAVGACEATENVLLKFRALGDRDLEGIALTNLGNIACHLGDFAEATSRFEEALIIAQENGDSHAVEHCLCNLALSARLEGDVERAASHYFEGLKLAHRVGCPEVLLYCLAGIVGVEVARRRFERAAWLVGAVATLADVTEMPLQPLEQEQFNCDTAVVRAELPNELFSQAWAAGRSLSLDAIVSELLDTPDRVGRASRDLTDRELDVLRLLARGHSDREIAEALFISPGTATTHVRNIRSKLGVHSRGAATAHAVRNGLL